MIVGAIDEEWQVDLVVIDSLIKENNGCKYLLTVSDVLSKYAWVETLKRKSGENRMRAFQKIFKKGRRPERLHTDKRTEFTNRLSQKFLKENDISFFTTYNYTKASIAKRFNRTLKLKYIDVLQKLVYSYNHSRHRSIGVKPVGVNCDNESVVRSRLYGHDSAATITNKFKVGAEGRQRFTSRRGHNFLSE